MLVRPKEIIDYVENRLVLTHGPKAGKAFKLLSWQRAFVRGAFKRGVYRAALSIPRGPGKTTLLAAIAASTLTGPLRQSRGETLLVASSLEQARICFDDCLAFVQPAIDAHPTDWKVRQSAQLTQITYKPTGANVRAIASDPRRAHGRRPMLVIADEPAQWPISTTDAMYAALNTSLGKSEHSRFVAIGTRPAANDHWFEHLLADADFSLCHKADPDADPLDPETWKAACPGLARLPNLLRLFRSEAKAASRDPALLAQFKALRLNLGVSDTLEAHLLDVAEWEAIEGIADKDGPLILGLDLGETAAMSAVSAYWPKTGRSESLAAFPIEPSLADREKADGVRKGLYEAMADRGELLTMGQRVVPVDQLLTAALFRFGRPSRLVADRWKAGELENAVRETELHCPIVYRGMGFKDGSEDVRLWKKAVLEGRVTPVEQLLMRSALSEARTISDPAGNIKIAKAGQGQRRYGGRDDPAVACVLAVAEAERQPQQGAAPAVIGVGLGQL